MCPYSDSASGSFPAMPRTLSNAGFSNGANKANAHCLREERALSVEKTDAKQKTSHQIGRPWCEAENLENWDNLAALWRDHTFISSQIIFQKLNG